MVAHNTEVQRTAFTISVDAAHGTTTGISAADRATTVRTLIDPATQPEDLARPGHIFPLRYREGGVLKRAGHTEAAVDLARLAGLSARRRARRGRERRRHDGSACPQLEQFAAEHGLQLISIADLIRYRRHREKLVRRVSEARIPTRYGDFTAYVFESAPRRRRAHGVRARRGRGQAENVLVRVHSECLTGDVFGSMRCDCGVQLDLALERIARGGPRRASCTSAVTRAAASASATRSAPTRSRTRAATPSRPTSSSGSRPTPASTASARRSSSTSGSPRCG